MKSELWPHKYDAENNLRLKEILYYVKGDVQQCFMDSEFPTRALVPPSPRTCRMFS